MALAVPPAKAKKIETGFLDRTVTVAGTQYKYQVFVPDNWTKKKKWPVILFLHGAGERADDGLLQIQVGIRLVVGRLVDQDLADRAGGAAVRRRTPRCVSVAA